MEKPPLNLAIYADFEILENRTYLNDYIGIEGAVQWDFKNYDNGRLQLDAIEKSMLITADQDNDPAAANAELILTMNFSQYPPTTSGEHVYFSFDYKIDPDGNNQNLGQTISELWVRGSDQEPWILTPSNFSYETWTDVPAIDLSKILQDNSQQWSTSTQVKIAHNSTKGLAIRSFRVFKKSPLPIDLSYFSANKIGENAQLQWKTELELENAYFEIERAVGADAANHFETIGRREGHGTTNEAQYYYFIDNEPAIFATNYYRLKQVDFNGNFSYSEIKVLSFNKFGVNPLIYPNPVEHYFFLEVDSKKETPVLISLFDPIGKLILEWDEQLYTGPNRLKLDIPKGTSAGMYTLRLKVNKEFHSYRLSLFH